MAIVLNNFNLTRNLCCKRDRLSVTKLEIHLVPLESKWRKVITSTYRSHTFPFNSKAISIRWAVLCDKNQLQSAWTPQCLQPDGKGAVAKRASERASRRRRDAMKSSFESQPDTKLAFLCEGRQEVKEADRGRGEEDRRRASTLPTHAQRVDAERRARPSARQQQGHSTARAGNTLSLSHTHKHRCTHTTNKNTVDICCHSATICTHTGNEAANSSQGQSSCPEAADPPSLIFTHAERAMATGKLCR